MKEAELKPCPYCGGKAILDKKTECWGHGMYITEHYVRCTECHARGRSEAEYDMKREECINKCQEAWNRRATDERAD